MADIAADVAWMRRHADRQATEDEARNEERWCRERAEQAKTCWFCFHEAHVIEYGGSLIDIAILHCRADGCLCGVPPCGSCGSRNRAPIVDRRDERPACYAERCADCGNEWQMAAYA